MSLIIPIRTNILGQIPFSIH